MTWIAEDNYWMALAENIAIDDVRCPCGSKADEGPPERSAKDDIIGYWYTCPKCGKLLLVLL